MSETALAQNKITIDAKKAAQLLGISYWSLLEMCKRGEVPYISIGKKRLFREQSLLQWINELERQSTSLTAA
ncbi:MAG TPA: helix-turn-helix domain-containing protein [Candidatus Wallbacteria bacterium]|nr:helix-turn-helix domain-containing protein [Candidatus Wallbacteria bacterium]